MSQLSFIDVSDMTKESTGGCCVIQDAEVDSGYFPSVHRLISARHSRSRLINMLRPTGCCLRHWEAFDDFPALAASELDIARMRTPESMVRYQKICDRYATADVKNMNEMFSLMVCALKVKFHDFLGMIFMELELGDNLRRQYFAPYSIQHLTARLLMPGIQDTVRREGVVTVGGPASGAAGVLIAYAECLLEADINPSWHVLGSCIGIDPVVADMAFIQLLLLSTAAEVVTGNTLTMQFNRVRYTSVYYFNDSGKRLSDLSRHRAMLAFMHGLSDAT